jgi:hypothetical protein
VSALIDNNTITVSMMKIPFNIALLFSLAVACIVTVDGINPRFDVIEIEIDYVKNDDDSSSAVDNEPICDREELIECRSRFFRDIGLQIDDDSDTDYGVAVRRRMVDLENGYGRSGFETICKCVAGEKMKNAIVRRCFI